MIFNLDLNRNLYGACQDNRSDEDVDKEKHILLMIL